MTYIKMLTVAVASSAVFALASAGNAGATVLCHTTTTPCGSKWSVGAAATFTLVSESTAKLLTTGGILENTCSGSTLTAVVTNAGNATTTNVLKAGSLSWTGCTSATSSATYGELELHNIAGADNGTVTAKGFAVTMSMSGLDCAYGAGTGIDLGELTISTGTDAVLHVNTTVKRNNEHSNVFCPETAKWVATYTQTSATHLFVEPS